MFIQLNQLCLGLAALAMASCITAPPFVCTDDAQCNSDPPGICVQYTGLVGACAVPAGDCPSGYRYHESAGQGQAGQCAAIPRFQITSVSSANEHDTIAAHITAFDNTGQKLATYNGTPSVSTTWDDMKILTPPVFNSGEADMAVSFNRANTASSRASFSLKDGVLKGRSGDIAIGAGGWNKITTVPILPSNSDVMAFRVSLFRLGKSAAYGVLVLGDDGANAGLYASSGGLNDIRLINGNSMLAPNVTLDGKKFPIRLFQIVQLEPIVIDISGHTSTELITSYNGASGLAFASSLDNGRTWTTKVASYRIGASDYCNSSFKNLSSPPEERALAIENDTQFKLLYTSAGTSLGMILNTGTCLATGALDDFAKPAVQLDKNGKYPAMILKEGTVYKGWSRDGQYMTSLDAISWQQVGSPLLPNQDRFSSVVWEKEESRFLAAAVSESGHEMDVYVRQ